MSDDKANLLTDRELLLRILDRQTAIQDKQVEQDERLGRIEKRLEEGDDRFKNVEANTGIAMNALRELCLARGLAGSAAKIDAALEGWGRSNGAGNHEEPTDPGPFDPPG